MKKLSKSNFLLLLSLFLSSYLLKKNWKRLAYPYFYHLFVYFYQNHRKLRPKRIILLRHGETTANLDHIIYSKIPDNQIPLTEGGELQAKEMGKKIKEMIKNETCRIYTSTFLRCKKTCEFMCAQLQDNKMKIINDPRIREQEWGNFQKFSENPENLQEVLKVRNEVGKMYYRFDHGESGCDVYVRVSSFLESLYRYMDHMNKDRVENIIIVTHGLTMRYFIMRFLQLSVEDFEKMWNPRNCEFWVLENNGTGSYKLISDIKGFN